MQRGTEVCKGGGLAMDSTVVGRKCKMRMNLWIGVVVDPGKISASIV